LSFAVPRQRLRTKPVQRLAATFAALMRRDAD
jgi:hypothetical protein